MEKPALAAAVAVAAMSGMYFAGNLASSAGAETVAAASQSSTVLSSASGQYTDGVYTGSGSGFRGTTQVQVTVSNGYITDISVLSTGDDNEFFSKAKSSVISQIISSQSVSVDTVSGATFSSNGIIEAVTNALASALGTSGTTAAADQSVTTSTTTTQETTSEESATETQTSVSTSSSSGTIALADGTYTGSGNGFRGETTVSVVVQNGTITSIKVTDYSDDEQFFSRAETTVINEIIAGQTPDVDAVSGATYSSNGIMEAVANALGIDFTATTPTEGRHGGHGGH